MNLLTHLAKEYPVAHRYVHVTHGDDVFVPLDFVTGCLQLSVPDFSFIACMLTYTAFRRMADVKPLTFGYKFASEIAHHMLHFRGEPPLLHPAFAPAAPLRSLHTLRVPSL